MSNGIRLEMDTFVPGDKPTVKTYLLLDCLKDLMQNICSRKQDLIDQITVRVYTNLFRCFIHETHNQHNACLAARLLNDNFAVYFT